jgi:hypothetical protein
MTTVSERVAAGLALLDDRNPGAAERIDVDRLDIVDCADCMLGQAYGHYLAGLDRLGLSDEGAIEFGFTAAFDESTTPYEVIGQRFDALTAEWRRVIAERRAQDADDTAAADKSWDEPGDSIPLAEIDGGPDGITS